MLGAKIRENITNVVIFLKTQFRVIIPIKFAPKPTKNVIMSSSAIHSEKDRIALFFTNWPCRCLRKNWSNNRRPSCVFSMLLAEAMPVNLFPIFSNMPKKTDTPYTR